MKNSAQHIVSSQKLSKTSGDGDGVTLVGSEEGSSLA